MFLADFLLNHGFEFDGDNNMYVCEEKGLIFFAQTSDAFTGKPTTYITFSSENFSIILPFRDIGVEADSLKFHTRGVDITINLGDDK